MHMAARWPGETLQKVVGAALLVWAASAMVNYL
jgi:hypothetical protein